MGVINPNIKARKMAVSVPTVAKAVVNTVSGHRWPGAVDFVPGPSLAKRNSVVSMPKVSRTRMSAT